MCEILSVKIDFATSESCATGAPPRMKLDHMLSFRAYRASFMGVSKVAMSLLCDKLAVLSFVKRVEKDERQ